MATSSPLALVPSTVLIDAKSTPPRTQPIGGMMIALTSVVDDRPERDADDDADRQRERVRLGQEGLEATHRLRVAQCSTTLVESSFDSRRSSPRPPPRDGDAPDDAGSRRDDFLEGGRQARRVAVRELGRGVDAGRLEQVGVLGADAA